MVHYLDDDLNDFAEKSAFTISAVKTSLTRNI